MLQAANASDRDVEALVEFGAQGASGQAGGTLPACQRVTIGFGSVSGDYRVLVEGEPAGAGVVPAGLGPEEAFVIRINVAPNGDVQVPPPIAMPEEPSGGAAIPGCGEE